MALKNFIHHKILNRDFAKKFFTFLLIFIIVSGFIQTFTPLAKATSYSYSTGSQGSQTSSGSYSQPSYSSGSSSGSYNNGGQGTYSYSSGGSSSTPSTGYSYSSGNSSSSPGTTYSYSSGNTNSGTTYSYSTGNQTGGTTYSYSTGQTGGTTYSYSTGQTGGTTYSYSTGNPPTCEPYGYCTSSGCYVTSPCCTNECTFAGQHQCSGTSGRTCGNYDSDSCLEWSSWQNCDSQCFYCGDGTCDFNCGENSSNCSQDCGPKCTNECSYSGQHQCSGTSGRTCGYFGSDSCLDWSNWQSCDSQCFSCGDGVCNSSCGENSTNCPQDCGPSCTNECSAGQHQCSGTSGRTCGNYDSDSCLEWSSWQNCDSQCFSCGDGVCNSSCGENSTNCPQDCKPQCTNECSYSGQHQCSGTSGRTCGYFDSDSCLDWSSWQNCDSQCFSCGDGVCNSSCGENSTNCPQDCGPSCISHNSQQCSLNDVYWYNSCGQREDKYQECGSDSCQAWGENYCSNGNVYHQRQCAHRGCNNGSCFDNSYTDTELVKTCPAQTTCQNGQCITTPHDFRVDIQKTVRNISQNHWTWEETTFAKPSDKVQFRIVITSLGADTLKNLTFVDHLPSRLQLVTDSVRIDGIPTSQNITTGAHIRDITSHQSRRVEFTAVVSPNSAFNYGLTTLTNVGRISNENVSAEDSATVKVIKTKVAGASTISTGTGNKWLDYFILPLLIALAGIFLFRKQFVLIRQRIDNREREASDFRARRALKELSRRH